MKYKIKDTDLYKSNTLYNEGSVIDLDKSEAEELMPYLILVDDASVNSSVQSKDKKNVKQNIKDKK